VTKPPTTVAPGSPTAVPSPTSSRR
jgi:hypothetical protein